MRINSLKLTGFKSFADKIVIPFSPGISVIVGPNGCGKSNLVDAVRWVLGEQSPRSLRGQKMEDVIFNGADGREPVNFAEVSLTLENEAGEAPPPYEDLSEINVARRLFRTGDSHYLINKNIVRRLDVRRLFMDTGVGESPYGIMSQGEVNLVLDSRPTEMRAYLEEVAGITRFKAGRAAALRKMELTSQNLLRLEDIISEVKRQVGRLKRQARKAEQFKKLKAEIRELKAGLLAAAYLELLERHESFSSSFKELTATEDAAGARMTRLEAEELLKRTRLMEKDRELEDARDELFGLKGALAAVETEMADIERHLREMEFQKDKATEEIGVHKTRLGQLENEIAASLVQEGEIENWFGLLEERDRELKQEHEGLLGELKGSEQRLEELTVSLADVSQKRALLKGTANAKRDRLGSIEKDREELAGRLSILTKRKGEIEDFRERTQKDAEGASLKLAGLEEKIGKREKSVAAAELEQLDLETRIADIAASFHRTVSRLQALSEVEEKTLRPKDAIPEQVAEELFGGAAPTALVELLEVEKGYGRAVDAALGEGLKGFLADRVETIAGSLDRLEQSRALLFPLDLDREPPAPRPKGAKTLRDKVRLPPGEKGELAAQVLARTLLADTFEEALKLWADAKGNFQVATAKGQVITRDGMVIAGEPGEITILSLRRETGELADEKRRFSKELEGAQQKRARLRENLEVTKRELDKLKEEAALIKTEAGRCEVTLIRLKEEQERLRDSLAAAGERHGLLEEEARGVYQFLDGSGREEELLREKEERLREDSATERELFSELKAKEEAAKSRVLELEVEEAGLRERLSGITREKERLEQFKSETGERIGHLKDQVAQAKKESLKNSRRLEGLKASLPEKYRELKAKEEAISKLREVHSKESLELGLLEEKKGELGRELKEISRERGEIQASFTETKVGLKYLVKRGVEHLRVDVSREGVAEKLLEVFPDAAESRVDLLEDKVRSLGPVNLTALEELEEETTRLEFLTAQQSDLVESNKALKEAISRIDKATKGRLIETLDRVNDKLGEIFPLLFDGGTATLAFTEPSNPLESGAHYLLRPPGKRLSTLMLLSGGEKALAALALLFSFYMIRPSPFLILDEVDAALDDANLERFLNLLKMLGQGSQLIAVTHKKRTMELADTLLGVTMEEPGVSKIISVALKGGDFG